jgi:RNA polymerase sigma-70 factor (ECF subfamily)
LFSKNAFIVSVFNIYSDREKEAKELQFIKNSFLEFYSALCSYAYRYVENTANAEDIVQDVFLDVWRKRNEIDLSLPLKPLLYKLTKNKSIDFLRSAYYKEINLEDYKEINSLEEYVRSLIVSQEDQLHMEELTQTIQQCVEELPEQCQKVFILSRVTGLKNKEIAEQLDVSVKAVEKQITKALHEIRKHLKRKGLLAFFLLFSFISNA